MRTILTSPRRGSPASIASIYLVVQAVAAFVWWAALLVAPAVRARFELDRVDHRVLSAFVVGDLVVIVGGSLLGAAGARRTAPWTFGAVATTAGATGYATLYLAAWVAQGGSGWLGLVAMIPATFITASIAWQLRGTTR